MEKIGKKALCAVMASLLMFMLSSCSEGGQNRSANAQDQQVENPEGEVEPVEPEPEPVAPLNESIIGVWKSGDNDVVFTDTDFFSLSGCVYTPYTLDTQTGTISFPEREEEAKVSLSNDGKLTISGTLTGSYSKDSDDAEAYIEENCVILAPGDEWSNGVVSVQAKQFSYAGEEGFETSKGSTFVTMTNQYCAECYITNLGESVIYSTGGFLINRKTVVNAAVTGGFSINPYAEEETIFSYDVAPTVFESVKDIEVFFRYYEQTESNETEYLTPLIIVRQ